MTEELNLSRQAMLVPREKVEETKLVVFGAGSVGSHFVKTAAKTGFKDIEVYDFDVVEEENIAAQAFDFEHIGKPKTEAIADIVKRGAGMDIIQHNERVTEETEIIPEPNTVYVCVFDSFEARKLVFNKVKDYPTIFVDGRIGQHNIRHYLVDCSETKQVENYQKSLEGDVVSELACGEKASAPINVQIAGMMIMNIINFIEGDTYEKVFIGNAKQKGNDFRVIEEREKEGEENDETGD